MGDIEGQRVDAKWKRADVGGSRATQRLAILTQSLGEVPEGFSWGRLVLRS